MKISLRTTMNVNKIFTVIAKKLPRSELQNPGPNSSRARAADLTEPITVNQGSVVGRIFFCFLNVSRGIGALNKFSLTYNRVKFLIQNYFKCFELHF